MVDKALINCLYMNKRAIMSNKKDLNLSSEEFLTNLRVKDPDAIEFLVHSYTGSIYKAALGLGFDSSTAEELVQSVWVAFYDAVPGFKGRSHIRTFIFGILYNKASELRRDQKHFDKDPIEEVVDSRFTLDGHWIRPPVDPEQFLITTQSLNLINKCIDGLPLGQRMAFCLREIDEQDSDDVCNILSISVTNLGVLLYRARNRLRECIDGKSKK